MSGWSRVGPDPRASPSWIPFDFLSEAHFAALITDQVTEKPTLEYKEALPRDTHDARREFLEDITSFASASGGHLIYAIKEEAGAPVALPGPRAEGPNRQILRPEIAKQYGISPNSVGLWKKQFLERGAETFG